MSLFIFSMVVFAVAYIVGFSKISLPFRIAVGNVGTKRAEWFLALIECPACLSTHLGWIAFLVLDLSATGLTTWWAAALYCCASSLLLAKLAGLTEE